MTETERLVAEATLEDKGFNAGVDQMLDKLDKTVSGSKELEVESGRLSVMLGAVAGVAAGATSALLDMILKPLTSSPQFAQFIGSIQAPLFQLSNTMGSAFKGTFDAISDLVKGVVNFIQTDPTAKQLMDLINKGATQAIKMTTSFLLGDDKEGTAGLLKTIFSLASAGAGVFTATVNVVASITGLKNDTVSLGILAGLLYIGGWPSLALIIAAAAGLSIPSVAKAVQGGADFISDTAKNPVGEMTKLGRGIITLSDYAYGYTGGMWNGDVGDAGGLDAIKKLLPLQDKLNKQSVDFLKFLRSYAQPMTITVQMNGENTTVKN